MCMQTCNYNIHNCKQVVFWGWEDLGLLLSVFCAVFLVAFKGWLYSRMRNHTVHIQNRLLLLNVLFHALVEYGHLKLDRGKVC